MKVSRAQVAENRQKILTAAGKLFRERGISGVNVAEIMDAAGLTHGAFYGYFDSKDDLVVAALGETLTNADSIAELGRAQYLKNYLSGRHRDNPGRGCSFAALATEAARQSDAVRAKLTAAMKAQVARIGRTGGGSEVHRRRTALADMATMIGAVALSRMVDDPKLSDEILEAARQALEPDR